MYTTVGFFHFVLYSHFAEQNMKKNPTAHPTRRSIYS